MTEQSLPEESIFLHALDMESAADREAYLDQACGDNAKLRAEVEALMRVHLKSGDLLDLPDSPAPTLDQPITEKPGTVIGPYKLRQQLGEGGFGVVFAAEQEEPVRRLVALKVIKPGMDTREVIARFEAERQALAVMDHPNIARVLDAGRTESGRPYFVMELVKGYPITEYCDARHLTPRERLELFVPVCQAVQHAHQKGIIHRDIKPSNVMIAEYDDRPVPKVIDFGVAKAIDQRLTEQTMFTQIGQVVGTLDYMSPEQAKLNQLDVDTRSDIYSLGVLLYELLTGETPFDRERLRAAAFDEMLRIIREDEPPRPSHRLSSSHALPSIAANRQTEPKKLTALVRGELDWILLKALEKDRDRRYETADAVAEDVRHYLNDEPVHACPPSMWYQLQKLARRKSGALVMTVVIALALFVAVGGISATIAWSIRDKEHRRNQLANRVELVLEEVEKHKQTQDWETARIANGRALTLLAQTTAHPMLVARTESHQKELRFVEQLQSVRLDREPFNESLARQRGIRDEARYARLFREFGIDVPTLSEDEASQRLREHPAILPVISTILDDWALLRAVYVENRDGAAKLRRLAISVDADGWRNSLRDVLIRRDREALMKLADSDDVFQQPPSTLLLLVANVHRVDSERGLAMLREAQRRYPRDFLLNYDAGKLLLQEKKPSEALPYLQSAHVLRPQNYGVAHDLAVAWSRAGFPQQAIDQFTELLRRYPDLYWPHRTISEIYHNKFGDEERALEHLKKALNCKPPADHVPMLEFRIGLRHQLLKRPNEALGWYQQAIRGMYEFIGSQSVASENDGSMAGRYRKNADGYFENLMTVASASNTDVRPFLLRLVEDYPNSAIAQSHLKRACTLTYHVKDDGREFIATPASLEHLQSSRELCEAECKRNPENPGLRNSLESICMALEEHTTSRSDGADREAVEGIEN